MLKKKRQAHIMEVLIKEEAMSVSELAELLDVSSVTIRKDLNELEQAGKLYRSHGKARIINPFTLNRSVSEKEKMVPCHFRLKRRSCMQKVIFGYSLLPMQKLHHTSIL